ncbi:hypothetical protein [Morganella morganii]|uniref:hypothetical protein n=1 Tax=Morganella morganii TaxID=582 RepID=UPI002FE549E1
MKTTLKIERIKNERVTNCPCCGNSVFKTMPVGWSKGIEQKVIFSDGDCIGGVWQRLTDRQKSRNAFAYFHNTGFCKSCGESFFAVEFNCINHHENDVDEILNTEVGQHLLLNKKMGESINYIVSQSEFNDVPQSWIMQVFHTPYGNMYRHTIGLIDKERIDESGDILLKLLDSLKLIQTVRKHIVDGLDLLNKNKKALIEVFNFNRDNDFGEIFNDGDEVTFSDCLNELFFNKDGVLEVTSENEIKKLTSLCNRTYIINAEVCSINNLPHISFLMDGDIFVRNHDLTRVFNVLECAKDCCSYFRISFQL